MLPLMLLLLSLQAPAPTQPACDIADDSCVEYLAHLDRASRAAPDSVWHELRYIATPAEVASWFSLAGMDERRAFLMRFWGARAARAAVPVERRYAEHVRRLERARRWYGRDFRYRLVGAFGANEWYAALEPVLVPAGRPDSLYSVDVDDRGLMYLRFGAPVRVERCSDPSMRRFGAGEIWAYAGAADGPGRLVFFATRGRAGDFQIVFGPGQTVCSERQLAALQEILALYDSRVQHASLRDLYSERHTLTEGGSAISQLVYDPIGLQEFAREAAQLHDRHAAALERAFDERLATRYEEELAAVYEILAFRSVDDTTRTTVVTSVAVPLAALRHDAASARAGAFRLRLGVVAADGNGLLASDTTAEFALPQAPRDALAAFHAEAAMIPGAYAYTLRLEGGGAALGRIRRADPDDPTSAPTRSGAGAVSTGVLNVPAFDAPTPSISSLAVGYPTQAPNTLRRPGSALSLVPTHVLPPDDRAVLYYELYGIDAGSRLQTRIEVTPRDERGDGLVVTFDEAAAHVPGTTMVAATRTLDFSDLADGVYDLMVSVRTADREVARQTIVDLSDGR